MKISIAMATYNGAVYIRKQLQSFVDQTYLPDELIVTDDCSTDETATIVTEFAKTAPFKVGFSRNATKLGYCGNFNAALMKTSGSLVFLSDQDDVWFPEKIEYMVRMAEQNPEALVLMNDAALTDGELNEVGLTKIGQMESAGISLDNFVMGCCCAVHRELLNMCLPIPSGFKSHDVWLVWFANGVNARIVARKVLQYYRRHDTNQSNVIVNGITKINRNRAFMHSVSNMLSTGAAEQRREQLEQMKIFVDSVSEIELSSSGQYHQELQELKSNFLQRIAIAENRMKVRSKSFFPRMIAVGVLLINGGYRNTSGIKAIALDLITRDF